MEEQTQEWFPTELRSRYGFHCVIGRGAMGIVCRAFDTQLRRFVAIKVVDPAVAGPANVSRFQREARLLGTISSPRVVRIFDSGLSSGRPYIVMECLNGHTLAQELEGGALPEKGVQALLKGLVEGLAALHAAEFLHRDLKPSNVFLTEDSQPVLIDFGLARSLDHTVLTEAGAIVGTPRYIAPELLLDGQPSVQSDLFAVGLMGFEALVGSDIHAAEAGGGPISIPQIISSLTSGTYFDTASRQLAGRGSLGPVILSALHPDLTVRFRSADEMTGALASIRPGPGVRTRGLERVAAADGTQSLLASPRTSPEPTSGSPPASGAGRAKRAACVLLAAGLLVAAALALPRVRARPAPDAVEPPPRSAVGPAPSPDPRQPPPLMGLSKSEAVRKLEGWSAAVSIRDIGNGLIKKIAWTPALRERAESEVRTLLSTSGLDVFGGQPAPIAEAPQDPSDQRLYWQLVWRLCLERALPGGGPREGAVHQLFPARLKPAVRQPAPDSNRTFEVSLRHLRRLPTDPVLGSILRIGDGTPPEEPPRWTLRVTGVGRVRTAWVSIRFARAPFQRYVRLTLNGRLSIALLADRGDPTHMSHTVPTWALREGHNEFQAYVDNFYGVRVNDHIPDIENFSVVLLP